MIGKWILIFGVLLVVVGAVVWLIETLGLPIAHVDPFPSWLAPCENWIS